ncbi:ferritin-like domain-containing protein [Ciceribacter azotifigens]|uniref:ferritin-like domain-containing protein n=1 Tax=Ciceribacter azotifigens TaxID=2069303 RepID=UPI003A8539F5
MSELRDNYIGWIRDAHAMEEQAITMLTSQAKRLDNYPELRTRIEHHIEETRGQSEALERVLDRLDGDPSMLKDVAGKFTATMQGMSGIFASDEVVKGTLAGYTFEHMEIESYRVLIAAAEAVGDTQSKAVFETILQQEEAMANWLAANTDRTVKTYLARAEADLQASH